MRSFRFLDLPLLPGFTWRTGYENGSTLDPAVPTPPNAFDSTFLRRFDERDEPPTASEADTAGPWTIEPVAGVGFALYRAGESRARGFKPVALFTERWLALLAAAVLPGTGREPLLFLSQEAGAGGSYTVTLKEGRPVGQLALFDESLVDHMNAAIGLIRLPQSLTNLLEAAGAVALERAGALLEERISPPDPVAV